MSKKIILIAGIVIFLAIAGVIGKLIYDRVYESRVNKTITDMGFNPSDYDLEGLSLDEIKEKITREEAEKITRQEIEKVLSGGTSTKSSAPAPTSASTGTKTCAKAETARQFQSEPYYTGQLFDAHVHIPVSSSVVSITAKQLGFEDMPAFGGSLTKDYLSCLFTEEEISGVLGFFLSTKYSLDQEMQSARNLKQAYSGIVSLFMPAPFDQLRVSADVVNKSISSNPGLFGGFGELKIFDGSSLDNAHFSELYKIASDYNFIVMMHPFRNDKAVIEKIVTQYPKIKFLLHGNEDGGWIMDVIKNHDNVYYSLDGNIIYLYGWKPEHYTGSGGPTKEEYLAYVKNNFDSIIAKEITNWKANIEAYPDRFLWGTDRWYGWHFDSDVGMLITEMGRSFIGNLDPTVREQFAYKNAEKLFAR